MDQTSSDIARPVYIREERANWSSFLFTAPFAAPFATAGVPLVAFVSVDGNLSLFAFVEDARDGLRKEGSGILTQGPRLCLGNAAASQRGR